VRVLVVEDEVGVATGVRRALEADGFTVDIEAHGTKGLHRAQDGQYDLIILDIMLPGTNGYRICRALREAGDWTPILMLTAKSGELDEAEGLETGADDYLTKPFHMVVFMARVHALVRRPRNGAAEQFTVGDLRLDQFRHRCWRGETEIELTAREVEVLAYLLSSGGRVVSKADIIATVWGDGFGGDPNIVEVYVRHLRKKLDEPFERRSIETVRGAGYRLVADVRA
jgi:DNA-binding response OmpR family regulator